MKQLDPLLPEASVDIAEHPAVEWLTDPWDDPDGVAEVERPRRQTRVVKWLVYAAMLFSIVAILIAGAIGWWFLDKVNPDGAPSELRSFTVESTDTIETLAARLEADGFISDAGVFEWYVERDGDFELTPGYYQLRADDHMGNVLGRLKTPPGETFTNVTFPEGFTIRRMADRLEFVVERMTSEDFIDAATDGSLRSRWMPPGATTLEGMLFPDTYQVSNAETEAEVIDRMIGLMERVGDQEDIENRAAQLGYTPYEVLIIASMIEREAKVPEDRAKISRVIRNRLLVDMELQIDAAVLYGREQMGLDPDIPFRQLRQIDGPYNVYLRKGLPPTPIANPGRASIQAALNPAPDPAPGDPICRDLPRPDECFYFFYVIADDEGRHVFAATPEQHEVNVEAARAAGLL